jgi:hypothetical protein
MSAQAMSAPVEPLWTVEDVARFTGMSVRWVREQAAAPEGPDRIPLIRLGGRVRFEPEQVREWALRGVAAVARPKKRS